MGPRDEAKRSTRNEEGKNKGHILLSRIAVSSHPTQDRYAASWHGVEAGKGHTCIHGKMLIAT
jgi:hypothetical protein